MDRSLFLRLSNCYYKSCRYFLVIFWFLGLLLGLCFAIMTDGKLDSVLRLSVLADVSIESLLVVTLMPLVFVFLAVFLSKPIIIILIAFLKAFILEFVVASYLQLFVNSGWLVCSLMMFGDIILIPFFWLVLIRWERYRRMIIYKDIILGFLFASAVLFVHYCFILPFWADLIFLQKG